MESRILKEMLVHLLPHPHVHHRLCRVDVMALEWDVLLTPVLCCQIQVRRGSEGMVILSALMWIRWPMVTVQTLQ